ncbi:MAG: hypothetical protein J2P18_07240 [Nocardia sp.]|nr:hypothetical protein [Nocardia sp.]
MTECRTREEVHEYLARFFNPDRQFRLYELEGGWLVRSVLTAEECESGQGLGLTSLVVDADTGVVYQYPSWSTKMVADAFEASKRAGERPKGAGQVYPPQWRFSITRLQEDPQTIQYAVRIVSLTEPPAENTEYQLTFDKETYQYQPPQPHAPKASRVISWAAHRSRTEGAWPSEGTWEV